MKKEYTKPNMEIVSFATENIATGTTSLAYAGAGTYQTTADMKTITYY